MKRIALMGVCALASASLVSGAANAAPEDKILEFDTMVGVSAPYTGGTNAIRGVSGGGRPWVLQSAKGELSVSGKLEIRVTGLVLADSLTNPVRTFRATVSCLSSSSPTEPSTVNVSTGEFPASSAGDSHIEAMVTLPTPCIAPIVFVTNPGGAWFAATGK